MIWARARLAVYVTYIAAVVAATLPDIWLALCLRCDLATSVVEPMQVHDSVRNYAASAKSSKVATRLLQRVKGIFDDKHHQPTVLVQ